jgi:hypothetical protein
MRSKLFFSVAMLSLAAFLILSCGGEGVNKDEKSVDEQFIYQ